MTLSFSTTTSFTPGIDGTSYEIDSIRFSTMDLSPLAPVFCSYDLDAIASIASSVNRSLMPSKAKEVSYCLIIEFFGSVRILTRSDFERFSRVVWIGSLPINSGIRPNLTKSSG